MSAPTSDAGPAKMPILNRDGVPDDVHTLTPDKPRPSQGSPAFKWIAIGSVTFLALAVLVLAFQLSRFASGDEPSSGAAGNVSSSDVGEANSTSSPLTATEGSNGGSDAAATGSAGDDGLAGDGWSQVQIVDEIEVSDLSSDTSKEVALSPDGRTAYVALEEAGAVSVVDLDQREVRELVFVGAEPQGVAVSPDGSRIYVAVYSTSELVTIDSTSLEEVNRVKLGDEWLAFNVAVSPDGSTLYVTRGFEPGVVKLDATTGANLGLIGTSDMGDTEGIAVTPDGRKLYVSDRQWVYIFDLPSGSFDRRFRLTEVERMKFTSDGKFLLTSSFSSDRPGILVLDAATESELGVILPEVDFVRGFAVTDDFQRVYVSARRLVFAGR